MPRSFRRGNVELQPNWQLGRDVRRSGVLDPEVRRLAELAVLGAKEIAVKEAFDTGDYFASIHVEFAVDKHGGHIAQAVADDFKAGWIERGHKTVQGTGTGRQRIRQLTGEPTLGFVKGRNILRRGARRAGLRTRAPRRRSNPTT